MKEKIIFTLIVLLVIGSCSFGPGGVTLAFRSSGAGVAAAPGERATVETGIVITDFLMSIREVEFKLDETAVSDPADIFFDGPYELDLLDTNGDYISQTIGEAIIPEGQYQSIRFKLHKTTSVEPTSNLYDRSIYIAGTIDGTPFEMWHDTSENLDIAEATGITVTNAPLIITIDFDLTSVLDQSSLASDGGVLIDLTTATDTDGDGLIEINPNSDDGNVNQDLADSLKDNLKLVADLIKS